MDLALLSLEDEKEPAQARRQTWWHPLKEESCMSGSLDHPTDLNADTRRPLWLSVLAGFSLLLGMVTTIPQFYYVLFGLHVVPIGPHTNLLGDVWYSILN